MYALLQQNFFFSFLWSAVSIIKMLWKWQNVNILNILQVHRRWFLTVLADPCLLETVPRRQQSGFAERNLCRIDVIWMKRSFSGFRVFFSVCRLRAVSCQPCLPETIDCSINSCFMTTKMTSYIINVDTSFRHVNYSDAFVSGRLPRFHIPKFHHISVTCWCVLPSDLVNMFQFTTTSHNHRFIKIKGVAVIVARATIKQRIISQPWLWSDS